MARDDDPWKRLREREEEEASSAAAARSGDGKTKSEIRTLSNSPVDQLSSQILPMIEQVNSLYNMYIGGIELKPPVEKQKQLEKLIQSLYEAPKPTPALRFRANSIQATFMTHKDKWDRLLKDLESGKVKRRGTT